MKKVLRVFAVLALLFVMVMGTLPVKAADVQMGIPVIRETLDAGWSRVSPTTTMHVLETKGSKATIEYVTTSLPATLEDNRTLIDNRWYLQVDPSGQWWFETGSNVFKARVTKDKISVMDRNGRLTNYASALSIEESTYSGGTPKIVDDPLTGSKGTCLEWTYGKYTKEASLTRYLRSNTARLSELWVLTENPGKSLVFRPNMAQENKFTAKTTPMIAFDSDYHMINVTENAARGFYVINPKDLEGVKYPVYIDPTYDFYNTLSDAWMYTTNSVYNTAWTTTSGSVIDGDFPAHVGQYFFISYYQISRSDVMFDTSSLPDNLDITATYLYLYGYSNDSDTDYNIYLCSGQPTYPHYPTTAADFNKSYYTTDSGAGYSTSTGWYTSGFNVLTLSNTNWVNKIGYTKLLLRSSKDISGIAPIGDEYVSFWQMEHGYSTAPNIRVIGTISITTPDVTTNPASAVTTTGATLNGYLNSDGGAECSTQFRYGPTNAYGYTTAWVAGFSTGESFNSVIAGLSPGTTYHFQAVATNTSGTDYGTDQTFTTAPSSPSFFSATAGSTSVTLNWTKGTGADHTYIMRKTGAYPTSISDGTNVYNDAGVTTNDIGLTNGTTYYYTAWSLAADGITYSITTVQAFATPTASGAPGVTTLAAYNVVADGATLQGNLTSLGGYPTADVWFEYGETLA